MSTPSAGLEKAQENARGFGERYAWCLNPYLSLGDLLLRLREELADGHERDCAVNVYLFACAIACTMDDFLDEKKIDLGPLARVAPSSAVRIAERVLNLPWTLRRRTRAAAWRTRWTACVDAACGDLLGDEARFAEVAKGLLGDAERWIPHAVLQRRMRLPEGFRCQDLTHHDVVSLAHQYAVETRVEAGQQLLVIGPRTAGAYFAPLVAATLRARHGVEASWITVRPKNGLSVAERAAIRRGVRGGGLFLLTDDHPNTGFTLTRLLGMLERLGARPTRVAVAVPGHPVNPGWTLPGVPVVVLAPEDRYQAKRLSAAWMAEVLGVPVRESLETRAMNRKFAAACGDGFQVRLKKLVDVGDGRVLAKGVGWGWLGYHACITAEKLKGFVPAAWALRDGFLFLEWMEGAKGLREKNAPSRGQVLGRYVARRAALLPLAEEPRFGRKELGWCGWDDLTATLRKVYGAYQGRLKQGALERRLKALQPPRPVLLDGQMRPADWIQQGERFYKTDFEQHNFGGGELDLTDAAWDLASAAFEFGMDETEEAELAETYRKESGDSAVMERLPLYQILCAVSAIRAAAYWIAKRPNDARQKQWAERYVAARDFAAFHVARHMGRHLAGRPVAWTEKLFFLDLDGVLDWNQMGFPHTTPNGVEALRILKVARFSVVVNTARSLEHVMEYSRSYGLAGGAAERGSVFWDAVSGCVTALVSGRALAALDRVREQLAARDGVFVDRAHRHSIRAFRFEGARTVRLREVDFEDVELYGLVVKHSDADTLVLGARAGKGAAVSAVRRLVDRRLGFTAAMGDSDADVNMLRAVDGGFAPANASSGIREAARAGRIQIMKRPLQAGLLEAARSLAPGIRPVAEESAATFLEELLAAADRPGFEKMMAVMAWRRL